MISIKCADCVCVRTVRCMHKKINSPSRSEWDKEAWRVRRNEERLNFKKEISGRDWVLTRVFRLSILSLGKKCGEGLWICLVWYEIQMLDV